MKGINKIKQIAAIVLLITFFLPLSRCSMKNIDLGSVGLKPETHEQPKENTKGTDQPQTIQYSYNIPYKMVNFDDFFSWIILLSFCWPIPTLVYSLYGKRRRIISVLKFLEPLACLGSGYLVMGLSFLGEIMYGGYLAIASIMAYFMVSSFEVFMVLSESIKLMKQLSKPKIS